METTEDWCGDGQIASFTVKKDVQIGTEMGNNFQGNDDDLDLNLGDTFYSSIKFDPGPQVDLDGGHLEESVEAVEDPTALNQPLAAFGNDQGMVNVEQTEMDNSTETGGVFKKSASKVGRIKPAICRHCHTTFPNTDLYEHHMSTEHQDLRPFSCRHCGKSFPHASSCQRHETIHDPKRFEGEPQFHCDLCPNSYHLKVSLNGHVKKVHMGYKPPKKSSKAPVLEHHSTKGTKNPNPNPYRKPKEIFPCPHCDLKFDMKCILNRHLIYHSKERPFPCPICQQPFAKETLVKTHIRNVHEKPTPSGMHHPTPKWQWRQPCPCTVCGKVFSVPSQLRYHMTLHTGEKPHACSTCGKKFRMKNSLKRHMILHDPQLKSNSLKLYKCRICGKDTFKIFSTFRNHHLLVHPQIPYESEKMKCFACAICGKPHFLRENAIICATLGHDPSTLHSAMFKFKCPECPPEKFGFRNLATLRKHWGESHSDKFLPAEFRKMYNQDAKEDDLPTVTIDKKKRESWKTEGIPEEILKSESPLYIELPLLSLTEEERLSKKQRKRKNKVAKELKCDLCGILVATFGNLKRHKKVVHAPNRMEGNRKEFQCSQCNKLFGKVTKLKAHERSHKKGYKLKRKGKSPGNHLVIKEETMDEPNLNKNASQTVNVYDANAVDKILRGKSVRLSLLKMELL